MKHALPPIINEDSRILILGTMPGEESLRRQEYYANPRNQFWRIMSEIYQTPLGATYSERVAFLAEHGLALWDVLESCERSGSLDQDIQNPVANNFQTLFETYRTIHVLVFNGRTAHKWFEQLVAQRQALAGLDQIQELVMPSTSPTATIPFSKKIKQWSIITKL